MTKAELIEQMAKDAGISKAAAIKLGGLRDTSELSHDGIVPVSLDHGYKDGYNMATMRRG